MTINDDKLREDISKVGGEMKCTALFLKDSIKENKFDPKKGKQKSAAALPRRAVKPEILEQIDKRKY